VTNIRWVLVQHGAGGEVPASALSGLDLVYAGPTLSLYENPKAPTTAPEPRWPLPLAGHLLAVAVTAAAGVALVREKRPSHD
jgi:hypothetical protein